MSHSPAQMWDEGGHACRRMQSAQPGKQGRAQQAGAMQTQIMSPQAAKYAAGCVQVSLAQTNAVTCALLGSPKLGSENERGPW